MFPSDRHTEPRTAPRARQASTAPHRAAGQSGSGAGGGRAGRGIPPPRAHRRTAPDPAHAGPKPRGRARGARRPERERGTLFGPRREPRATRAGLCTPRRAGIARLALRPRLARPARYDPSLSLRAGISRRRAMRRSDADTARPPRIRQARRARATVASGRVVAAPQEVRADSSRPPVSEPRRMDERRHRRSAPCAGLGRSRAMSPGWLFCAALSPCGAAALLFRGRQPARPEAGSASFQ